MNRTHHMLIFSASYGSGHTRAAKALEKHLPPSYSATHIDILSFIPSSFQEGLRSPYTEMTRRTPKLWGAVYQAMKSRAVQKNYHRTLAALVTTRKKHITSFIRSEAPDTIICTHFAAAHMLDVLTKQGVALPPHYVLMTDYGHHPLWESKHASGYFVPTHDTKREMLNDGVKKDMIHVTGIPVDPICLLPFEPQEAKKLLGLSQASLYLIMTGGYGLVDPTETIDLIESCTSTQKQIIVITGKNHLLEQSLRLEYAKAPYIQIVGWTDNIITYLQAADLVCTKPGGITVSECLTMKKPMYVYAPVPGQETDNEAFLLKHSLAFTECPKGKSLQEQIKQLDTWDELFDIKKILSVL